MTRRSRPTRQHRRLARRGRCSISKRATTKRPSPTCRSCSSRTPDNPGIVGALAEALTNLKKYDEALKYCDEVIKLAPKATLGYNLRARST